MNIAFVFLVWSFQIIDLNLALETSQKEVDILWQKYGELRSELETVKAKRKSDIKRVLTLEKDVTIIQGILEKSNSISGANNNESLDSVAISDDKKVVPVSAPEWKDCHFQLLQASIQSSGSQCAFSLDVIVTDDTFTYQWYEDKHIPIFPGDQNFSIIENKIETRYRLTLIARHSREYLQNNLITIRMMGDSEVQMFVFQYTDQNVTKLYQGNVQYRISPDLENKTEGLISGDFIIQSNLIANKTMRSYIMLTGLNETSKQGYDALLGYAFADGKYLSSNNISLTQNKSLSNSGFQMMKWTVPENIVTNGGLLDFAFDMEQYDDIFNRVFIFISDFQTLSALSYSFPKHFLTIIKDKDPIYIKQNQKNIIGCSAMGRPVPTLSFLEEKSNGDLVPIGYPSLLLQKGFSAYAVFVIKNATKQSDMSFVCVAQSGMEEKVFKRKVLVGTPAKISHVNLTRNGEVRVIHFTVTSDDPDKTSLMCYENEKDGPSIWERYNVYTSDEIRTDTTLEYTITADLTDAEDPPSAYVCVVYSPYGTDTKTIKLN